MNLNIFEKDNIICILLINVTIYLNSIKKPNKFNLKNCIKVLSFIYLDIIIYGYLFTF
jgi:hypothetical protein